MHIHIYSASAHQAAIRGHSLASTRYCFTSKLYCGIYPPCIAILLHAHCAIYAPPPTLPVYAVHHTILMVAISCKGQVTARPVDLAASCPPLGRCKGAGAAWPLISPRVGLYRILPVPIVYSIWHTKGVL